MTPRKLLLVFLMSSYRFIDSSYMPPDLNTNELSLDRRTRSMEPETRTRNWDPRYLTQGAEKATLERYPYPLDSKTMSQYTQEFVHSDWHYTKQITDNWSVSEHGFPILESQDGDFQDCVSKILSRFRSGDTYDTCFSVPGTPTILSKIAMFESFGVPIAGILLEWIDRWMTEHDHPLKPDFPGCPSDYTKELAIQLKAGWVPETLIQKAQTWLCTKIWGKVVLDTQTGILELTPQFRAQGNNLDLCVTTWYLEFLGSLGLEHRVMNRNQFHEALYAAAKKCCTKEAPAQELDRKLAREKDLPAPQELAQAPKPQMLAQATEGPWAAVHEALEPLFSAYDLTDPLHKEHMTRFLCAMAARTYAPGSNAPWTLVMSGKGGTGKTAFGLALALDSAPAVIIPAAGASSKGNIERIVGSSIAILDEFDEITRKSEISELKDFISANSFKVRFSFRRDAETVPASWAILATQNSPQFTQDDGAQMRRYAWLPISGGQNEGDRRSEFLIENRERIHAIAALLYKGGYPFTKYRDPEAVGPSIEESMVEVPDTVATASGFLPSIARLIQSPEGKVTGLNLPEIWELVAAPGDKYSPRKAAPLTKALEEQGWTVHRFKGNKRVWLPAGVEPKNVVSIHPDQLAVLRRSLANCEPTILD